MQSHPPKWQSLVLVCNNQRPAGAPKPSCGHHGGAELRDWLKERLKAEGLWSSVRVVSTGCLDICAEGVTVVLDNDRERLVVHPTEEREALLERIRAQVAAGRAAT